MIPGRKPKPTELKKLGGNPGKRPLNENEPKPYPLRPQKPTWLSPEVSAKWDETVLLLERMRVLTEADGDILTQYCTAFVNWQQCELMARGLNPVTVFTTKTGERYLTQNPIYIMAQKYNQLTAKLGELLGLNPSARTRISASEGVADEEAEAYLFGKTK